VTSSFAELLLRIFSDSSGNFTGLVTPKDPTHSADLPCTLFVSVNSLFHALYAVGSTTIYFPHWNASVCADVVA
jgi:hypothetical protein